MNDMVEIMKELCSALFSGGFMPHGYCYRWTPYLVWLHVISDSLITLAYYSIPFTLAWFVRRRRDIDFGWMFLCFAAFILACGTTHLLEIWNIWHGDYWLSGGIKAITAVASITTAILLTRLMPHALALPSPAALQKTNDQLTGEIAARLAAEEKLRLLNVELERRVTDRTAELEKANASLKAEIVERKQALDALRESEELFEKAFRLSPDLMSITRFSDRMVLRANETLCKLWGKAPEDIVGRPVLEFFEWGDDADREQFIKTLQETGECLHFEAQLKVIGNGVGDFDISSRLISFNGESCLITLMRDITEKTRIEEAAARLVAIVESSEDAIIGKDLNGLVTSWNSGAKKILGYTEEEMIGQPILRLIPPDKLSEETAILEKVSRGESLEVFDTVRLRRDGSRVDVAVTISPIRDSKGKITGASKIIRNISERKVAEQHREASDNRMKLATEATGVGIWEWNLFTNQMHWDLQMFRIHGLEPTPEGLITYNIWKNAILPEDFPSQEQHLNETVRSAKGGTRDFRILRADNGECRHLRVVETVRTDSLGQTEWVVGTSLDITERVVAEEKIKTLNLELESRVIERTQQLEDANRELEAFSYSISHDLRAPLRAMDGFSHALVEDYSTVLPEEGVRYLKIIRGAAQKMGILIDDLLTFSRLSRLPLRKQVVATGKLVREVVEELTAQQPGRVIDWHFGNLPDGLGDAPLLRQVWINLLANALKYTRKCSETRIEIGCDQTSDGHVYYVRDNGAGFDMRYAEKLFGVFQRLHRAEDYEGTGVGLAIVQRVIHRHGGRIWADAAVDRGATFYFTLEEPPSHE